MALSLSVCLKKIFHRSINITLYNTVSHEYSITKRNHTEFGRRSGAGHTIAAKPATIIGPLRFRESFELINVGCQFLTKRWSRGGESHGVVMLEMLGSYVLIGLSRVLESEIFTFCCRFASAVFFFLEG
jgi:hypothetical protein